MTPGSSVQNCRLTSILRRGLAVRLWLENSSDAATKRDGSWRTDRNCSGPGPAAAADSPAAVTLAKVNDIAAARNAFQSCCRSASRQGANCRTKTSLHDPMIRLPRDPGSIFQQVAEVRYCTKGQRSGLVRPDGAAAAPPPLATAPQSRLRSVSAAQSMSALLRK